MMKTLCSKWIFRPCGATALMKQQWDADSDGGTDNGGDSDKSSNGRRTRKHSSTGRRVPVWSLRFHSRSSSSSAAVGPAATIGEHSPKPRRRKINSLRYRLMQIARMRFLHRKKKQDLLAAVKAKKAKKQGDLEGPLLVSPEESPGVAPPTPGSGHLLRIFYSGGPEVKAKAQRLYSRHIPGAVSSLRPY